MGAVVYMVLYHSVHGELTVIGWPRFVELTEIKNPQQKTPDQSGNKDAASTG